MASTIVDFPEPISPVSNALYPSGEIVQQSGAYFFGNFSSSTGRFLDPLFIIINDGLEMCEGDYYYLGV